MHLLFLTVEVVIFARLLTSNWSLWLPLLSINCLLGVLIFEWAWGQIERVRKMPEDLLREFPLYRRADKPEKWTRWDFYAGLPLLLPRLIGIFFFFFAIGLC